jgi:hypothetical protein
MMRMGATRWVTKALPPTVLEDIAREYGKSPVREMSELKSDVGPSGLLEAAADGTRCPAPLPDDAVGKTPPVSSAAECFVARRCANATVMCCFMAVSAGGARRRAATADGRPRVQRHVDVHARSVCVRRGPPVFCCTGSMRPPCCLQRKGTVHPRRRCGRATSSPRSSASLSTEVAVKCGSVCGCVARPAAIEGQPWSHTPRHSRRCCCPPTAACRSAA